MRKEQREEREETKALLEQFADIMRQTNARLARADLRSKAVGEWLKKNSHHADVNTFDF
jgi:hypothetical protein